MSDTPRTDEEERTSERYDGEEIPGFDYVSSDFARTLERELKDILSDATYYIRKSAVEKLEQELSAATKDRDEWKRRHDDTESRLTRLLSGLPRTGCKPHPVE